MTPLSSCTLSLSRNGCCPKTRNKLCSLLNSSQSGQRWVSSRELIRDIMTRPDELQNDGTEFAQLLRGAGVECPYAQIRLTGRWLARIQKNASTRRATAFQNATLSLLIELDLSARHSLSNRTLWSTSMPFVMDNMSRFSKITQTISFATPAQGSHSAYPPTALQCLPPRRQQQH
jgi:hypothetical protein